eukprot:879753-Pyramimonas_sp.AAC.1
MRRGGGAGAYSGATWRLLGGDGREGPALHPGDRAGKRRSGGPQAQSARRGFEEEQRGQQGLARTRARTLPWTTPVGKRGGGPEGQGRPARGGCETRERSERR